MAFTWANRWPNFQPEEVLSPDGLRQFREFSNIMARPEALDKLQGFRVFLGKQILVNHAGHRHRGYRSPGENQRVKGKMYSFHMQGVAFDISVPGMTPSEVAQAAEQFGWIGIGVYRTFVHIDLRVREDEQPFIFIGKSE